jgi:hypothetical protein
MRRDFSDEAMETSKFSGTDGRRVWNHRYFFASGTGWSRGICIGLTNLGDPVVVGSHTAKKEGYCLSDSDEDVITLVYDRQSGSPFWQKRWSSPGRGDDVPLRNGLKVASNGDVVVAGNTGRWSHGIFAFGYAAPARPILPPPGLMEIRLPGLASPLDNGTTIEVGSVRPFRFKEQVFVITNPSGGPILGITARITGEHANQFWLCSPSVPSSVLEGESRTFRVSFQPGFVDVGGERYFGGERNASLIIGSAGGEDFEVKLKARAVTARMAFEDWAIEQRLTGLNAGPEATPANDGISNLLKFAFNMDHDDSGNRNLQPGGG